MLNFLILTTTALLAVSMLVGMLLGYAAQRNLLEVRTAVRRGALSGAIAAFTLALLELTTGFVVREYYNLVVLCGAIAAEIALLLLLATTRSLAPEKTATRFFRVVFFTVLASWGAFYLPDIFIYPSRFAVGIVQVASSEFVFIVTGYTLGIGLCLLTAYAVFRVCAVVPELILFPLFLSSLLAFCAAQIITVGQILLGRGLVPRHAQALDAIIFLLNNAQLLLYWSIAAAALTAVILWLRCSRAVAVGGNPAQRRKARSLTKRHLLWSKTVIAALLVAVLVMTVGQRFNDQKMDLSPPQEMTAVGGEIVHPTAVVGDGALHRFVYRSRKGAAVRYIIIKKNETAYGVGLDACDVCGPSGYYERKGQVICMLCDVVMNKSTIGFAGGCNPVPLRFSLKDGNLVIATEDLEAEAPRFM
ncbi:MAG: DUF2318 domain-containing protein [Desulfovibrio sp.]|jgi:uncharacterized membrane protein|nr:DUF2318 domain-containing protein [Desulfovibrio sp.]